VETTAGLPAAPAPAPGSGRGRAWAGLALLLLLSAPLSLPYQLALSAQSPYVVLHGRVAHTLVSLVAGSLLFVWPFAFAGLVLGERIGWGAPFLAGTRPWREAVRPFAGALLVGVLVGAFISVAALVVPRLFPAGFATGIELPPPAPWKGALGALGAGVSEEVAMRLFLMTALAWLLGRARGRAGPPTDGVAWGANALAALAFGALHFSNVAVLGMPFSFANLSFVLLLNGGLGLACGELYRRSGIECAILAHFAAALVAHGVFPALARVL